MGDPNSDGWRWGTRYQRAARRRHPAFVAVSQERASIPISASPAPVTPTQPPIKGRWDSGEDAGTPEPLVNVHPAFLCSIQGRVRFPGRSQNRALKCSMRPRIYRLSTLLWCMRNCSTAAPGGASRRYPHLRRFQGCAAEKVGTGRRDLVKPLCHLSDFRVSGNSTSSLWQTHLVLVADW
jgi:hypothetical protein